MGLQFAGCAPAPASHDCIMRGPDQQLCAQQCMTPRSPESNAVAKRSIMSFFRLNDKSRTCGRAVLRVRDGEQCTSQLTADATLSGSSFLHSRDGFSEVSMIHSHKQMALRE